MTNEPSPAPETLPQPARPWRIRRWVTVSVLGLVIVVSGWRLLFFNVWEDGESKPPVWDGKPRFVETTYSKRVASHDATLWQRMLMAYLDFRMRYGKKNPATCSFPASTIQPSSIHGLLNQCMEMSGTRYLIAYEVGGGSVRFGHTNVLNGAQWLAAFEAALQTNQPEWFDNKDKCSRRENLLVIREKSGVVKVVPPSRLGDYQKAGLISALDVPDPALAPPVSLK